MSRRTIQAIGLALLWVFVTGTITVANLVVGFVLGYIVLLTAEQVPGFRSTATRLWRWVALLIFFLRELWVSNLNVAYLVIAPRPKLAPGVVAVPLDVRTDAEITLLANLITLTPGTMSVDVSDDRRVLYVHGVDVTDRERFIRSIKDGFERRIMEVMR